MTDHIIVDDERALIGHYKALGLVDSDAIYAEKLAVLRRPKEIRAGLIFLFWVFLVVGLGIVVVVQSFWGLLIPAIPVFVVHTAIKKKNSMIEMINSVTAQYCKDLGVDPA